MTSWGGGVPGTVPLPVITDDPQTYAEYLFAAWQNNDKSAAANVASTDAVNQMFAQAYPAKGPYTFASCGPAAGSLYCTWNGQNGASIQMQVRTLARCRPARVDVDDAHAALGSGRLDALIQHVEAVERILTS